LVLYSFYVAAVKLPPPAVYFFFAADTAYLQQRETYRGIV